VLNSSQVNLLIDAIRTDSRILMGFYQNPGLTISEKDDLSPVSEADLASNQFITEYLKREFPEIPLISEEGVHEDWSSRRSREYSWILDPLDGTKEFIAGSDEFAINLALLRNGKPVFGMIAIPAKNEIYYALKGQGSWKIDTNGNLKRLPLIASDHEESKKLTVLISRSHAGAAEIEYCRILEQKGWLVTIKPAGSAYKHALLAEGSAHLYFKPGICWEWDTAPGQLIIEEAGGLVRRTDTGEPMVYNKENFINPPFTMWAPGVFIPL